MWLRVAAASVLDFRVRPIRSGSRPGPGLGSHRNCYLPAGRHFLAGLKLEDESLQLHSVEATMAGVLGLVAPYRQELARAMWAGNSHS